MMEMRAGAHETGIQLVNGMDMTGYLARQSGSEGIHDELKIKCVAFDDGSSQFVLVVCDLLGLDAEFTKNCINEAAKRLAIPTDYIVIASTHTHSGPASIFLQDCGEVDESWLEGLKLNIVECIIKAYCSLATSKLVYRTCECNIGINRIVEDKILAERLVDQRVGVLELRDAAAGNVKLLLVNYACHPVVLTQENLLYSKDYPNFMIQTLKQREEYKDAIIIFANGCCGDVDPSERGGYSTAEKLGRKLGEKIADHSPTVIDAHGFQGSKLKVSTLKVPFRLKEVPFDAPDNSENVKLFTALKKWKTKMEQMRDDKTLMNTITADIKIIAIGKMTIVTLPFEAFHEIGLEIKKHFGPDTTMVLCYANGDYGYFPSKALYDIAGYEAGMAYKFYGYPGPLAQYSEDVLYHALFSDTSDQSL